MTILKTIVTAVVLLYALTCIMLATTLNHVAAAMSTSLNTGRQSMWYCDGYKYNAGYATEARLKKHVRGL